MQGMRGGDPGTGLVRRIVGHVPDTLRQPSLNSKTAVGIDAAQVERSMSSDPQETPLARDESQTPDADAGGDAAQPQESAPLLENESGKTAADEILANRG